MPRGVCDGPRVTIVREGLWRLEGEVAYPEAAPNEIVVRVFAANALDAGGVIEDHRILHRAQLGPAAQSLLIRTESAGGVLVGMLEYMGRVATQCDAMIAKRDRN